MSYQFTEEEINQILEHGLTVKQVQKQIDYIMNGVKSPLLCKPAKLNDGIFKFNEVEMEEFIDTFENYKKKLRFTKFVPASGAATRMFKSLGYTFHNHKSLTLRDLEMLSSEKYEYEKTYLFLINLEKFPFSKSLKQFVPLSYDSDVIPILEYILTEKGLNFLNTPKGFIDFHIENRETHTPVSKHLHETLKLFGEQSEIHFTISQEHKNGLKFHITKFFYDNDLSENDIFVTYSYQSQNTDSIALYENGEIVKDKEGKILFRPAGHGALINNLNEINADFIYINNIDNIAHSTVQNSITDYKKVLTGFAINMRQLIGKFLPKLKHRSVPESTLQDVLEFFENFLMIKIPENFSTRSHLVKFLYTKLNRPFRVVGVVKNEGEPGGGPFWVKDEEGNESLQIVEKAQINPWNSEQKYILDHSTHFNPVDMVCSVQSYDGRKYDLRNFVHPDLGIVTKKFYNGDEIWVYELPGLWNGAMHNWITLFVELPSFTFNPVKEVNDLLKKNHSPHFNSGK